MLQTYREDIAGVGSGWEKMEILYVVGRNIKWWSQYGKKIIKT